MAKVQNRKKKRQAGGAQGWIVLALTVALVVLLTWLGSGRESAQVQAAAFEGELGDVRFSEIMASNASTLALSDGSMPDWIELHNGGERDVSLSGWAIMPEDEPSNMMIFPDVTIPAGGYLLVYCDDGSGTGEIHAPFRLAASGETLVLMDASGATVDRVAVRELGRDEVYCRDALDEWQVSRTPTPGEANRIAEADGEAAAVLSAEQTGAVQISEVMSRNVSYAPDSSGNAYDIVELHNTSSAAVSLKGWFLSNTSRDVKQYEFPDVSIPADGYLIVYCSGGTGGGSAELHAPFRLSGDGAQVILSQPGGQVAGAIQVPALENDQSYALVNGQWTAAFTPTPGFANTREGTAAVEQQMRAANPVGVYITEIAASSDAVGTDWIEIYNGSSAEVDLSGYGLSDNAGRPRKWQFPTGTTIEPGAYLGILLTEDEVSGQLCASFRLSMSGGYSVTLCTPDGTIIDRVPVPQQYTDISYGRVEGRSGFYFFDVATPQTANTGTAYVGRASVPEYSVRGGLYETGDVLSVELSSEPGTRIYYTLDNTDPTEASTLYTGPITVSETTILRTRVYGDGMISSLMDTQSYLYDVNNGNGVYVVSMVSDPDNLFSDEKGIMVKGPNAWSKSPYGAMNQGANFWMDWEREAHIEVYGGDGEQLLSQECGVKMQGQYSRSEKQQAFKIIARSKYGGNRFPIKLFSNRDYTEYQSFVLRSSGQDTDKTRMRDSILTSLASETSVMYQETEVCVLYIDGQYWGQYNLRERVNTTSICQFEGWEGDEDDLDLVKANTNTMQGSNETFAALLEWVKKTDPTSDAFYDTLDQAIDIRNYIEYMAIQIFTGNTDTLNVKRYRNPNADGKWRWVLFDLDWAFVTDTNSINRWLTPGGMGSQSRTDNTLFVACMQNPRFYDEFLTYMGQQMATVLTTDTVVSRMQERYAVLEPLMPDQQERWGYTMEKWYSAIKSMISYAEERPTKLLQYFSGSGVSGSRIKLTQDQMMHYFGDAIALIQGADS